MWLLTSIATTPSAPSLFQRIAVTWQPRKPNVYSAKTVDACQSASARRARIAASADVISFPIFAES